MWSMIAYQMKKKRLIINWNKICWILKWKPLIWLEFRTDRKGVVWGFLKLLTKSVVFLGSVFNGLNDKVWDAEKMNVQQFAKIFPMGVRTFFFREDPLLRIVFFF